MLPYLVCTVQHDVICAVIMLYCQLFSDLVRAYKSLNKEKEALEASLKALSASKPVQPSKSSSKLKETKDEAEGDKVT